MVSNNLKNRKLNRNFDEETSQVRRKTEKQINRSEEEKNDSDFIEKYPNLLPSTDSYYLTRIILVRFSAFIYAVAFLIAFNQNIHLLGKNGLNPANIFMKKIYLNHKYDRNLFKSNNKYFDEVLKNFSLFLKLPSLFWFFDWSENIDYLLNATSVTGLVISLFILFTGTANSLMMITLWLLYHSIVNIGQIWYSFGWESQVLESGFIAIFLVPIFSLKKIDIKSPPSIIPVLLYRWLIFRIMMGAGLIKIRGDKCWKDFTCMDYHYETQPVPNPISFYMHKEPAIFHKLEVLVNHFVELVAPAFCLIPVRSIRMIGGLIQIIFQIVLIISGNLSFLNWLTILPSLSCFDDRNYMIFFSKKPYSTLWSLLKIQYYKGIKNSKLNIELSKRSYRIKCHFKLAVNYLLLALIAYLSMPVVLNLLSAKQAMNTSFEPFRLVNTYGAFGSVTKQRYEVIVKGTLSENVNLKNENVEWKEYEFNCKPGLITRRPCIISPYHYRLDWLMWFAAFQTYEYNPWLLSLMGKFLLNDKNFTNQMIAFNPFKNTKEPKFVKADLYLYKFTQLGINSTNWWDRKFIKSYLPPIGINHLKEYLNDLEWNI